MKHMKVARGTARAKRRAITLIGEASAESARAAVAHVRSHLRRLTVTLHHKASTAKLARNSPFA